VGNRYGPRADEFDWNVGVRRRLKRYLASGLSYAEIAYLLGASRGAVAGATDRYKLQLTAEQQKDHRARQGWERARHGRRSVDRDWDSKLIETWEERKRRKAKDHVSG
jgi:hypothetical protein